MKKFCGVLPFIVLFIGCSEILPPPPDERKAAGMSMLADVNESLPDGWVKHDSRDCKFSFSQDVVITHGFYKGRTGAVMELRTDGYVVDIYGYWGQKPSGRTVHRDAVIYGVPEEHMELHDPKSQVR